MKIGTHDTHPAADVFPLLQGGEFEALCTSVADDGLISPILICDGKILDGRNRYRACVQARVSPRFEVYEGDDPIGHVIALNLHRRHLNESQRAMVAARIATLPKGSNQHAQICAPSQQEAADRVNVSRRAAQYASKVDKKGTRELVAAVDNKRCSVSQAAQIADEPEDFQREVISRSQETGRTVKQTIAEVRNETTVARAVEWPEGKYLVILADPPWAYSNSGLTQSANHAYPTMTVDELKHEFADKLAAATMPETVLFMWATSPLLRDAFRLLDGWGFHYKASMVWHKNRAPGIGWWVKTKHEFLLIATRDPAASPHPRVKLDSVINADVGGHSRKPVEFYEAIEAMYDTDRKLEMFARSERSRWVSFGNETC